jgi:hypothetical protein
VDEDEIRLISEFLSLVEPLVQEHGNAAIRVSYASVAAVVADLESGKDV